MAGTNRVAVLIDCDNISPKDCAAVLAEAAQKGTLSVKRGYGDWSKSALSGWKKQLPEHGIEPMQQPAYVAGKNASDSALIIDAMDLLYADNVDTFFLVSSDSDFTRLAMRLRESGRRVYGIGAQKTHVSFQNACDRFTFLEVLDGGRPARRATSRPDGSEETNASTPQDKPLDSSAVPDIKKVLVPAVEATAADDGWANLSAVGTFVVNNVPTFDARNYGSPRLGALVRTLSFLEVKDVVRPDGASQPYVRVRPARTRRR